MSSAPAVPPLPQDFSNPNRNQRFIAPPVPPLPQGYNEELRKETALAAPMPERAMPSLPADISSTLDDSLYTSPQAPNFSLHPASGGPGGPNYRRVSPAPSVAYGGPQPFQGYTADQLYAPNKYQSPSFSGYPGGFSPQSSPFPPPRMGPSPVPPTSGTGYDRGERGGLAPPLSNPAQTFPTPASNPYPFSLPTEIGAMSLGKQHPRPHSAAPYPGEAPPQQLHYSYSHSPPLRASASPSQGQGPPALTVGLPTPTSLAAAQNTLSPLTHPPYTGHSASDTVGWIRAVFFCVDRTITQQQQQHAPSPDTSADNAQTPIVLHAPLPSLLHGAISKLIAIVDSTPASSSTLQPHMVEALYLKGTLYASAPFLPALASPNPSNSSRYSGSPVTHGVSVFADLEHSPRLAFQHFTAAARGGFTAAWFKLGRDYELVGDGLRARDCFERGAGIGGTEGSVGCLYRLGMAYLLGQLSLPASTSTALPLLHRAAMMATAETPQPAYVYGLIFLNEFERAKVADSMLKELRLIPRGSSRKFEARRHIERAAYLCFAPAQYKLGHAYEYAVSPFPFDALLSVQYYSLASQQGECEADMALSKWFLCGAEGAFEKDEALAVTFAEKAARKGLASAEFALGYYAEVGVGGLKDIELARKWYAKAVSHGNPDAPERLRALLEPSPVTLSRTEHDAITDAKLVRTRTQARIAAQKDGRYVPRTQSAADAGAVVQRMKAEAEGNVQIETLGHKGTMHGYGNDHGPETRPPQEHSQTIPTVGTRQPQVSPSQTRYSLTDSPAPMGLPTSPAPSGRAPGRPPGHRSESIGAISVSGSAAPQPTTAPGPGPGPNSMTPPPPSNEARPSPRPAGTNSAATFQEMGFAVAKAEDKDCCVM